MPIAADIVVKKADNTTNVTYSLLTASAGDSSPARWTETSLSTNRAHRPTLEVRSQFNGPRTARRSNVSFKYPVLRTASGVVTRIGDVILDFSVLVPQDVDDVTAAEAVAQGTNLAVSSLIRSALTSAYAPV